MGAGKKGSAKSSSIDLEVGGEVCFDRPGYTVAETFNKFFVNVASSLMNKLPAGSGRYGLDFVSNFYTKLNVKQNILFAFPKFLKMMF